MREKVSLIHLSDYLLLVSLRYLKVLTLLDHPLVELQAAVHFLLFVKFLHQEAVSRRERGSRVARAYHDLIDEEVSKGVGRVQLIRVSLRELSQDNNAGDRVGRQELHASSVHRSIVS